MNREKFLPAITILICCVLAFFIFNLIYAPLKSATLSMQMQAHNLQDVEHDLDKFKKRHGDLEKFFASTESGLIYANEFLPAESAQDAFAAEIYKIADNNNVLINSIQIGELQADNDKKIFRQTVNLKFEADYISTLKFLREILNGNRLTTLENVSIEGGENILSCNIELSIFNLAASG